MNREIKFRGKRVDNGEWIEGFYYEDQRDVQTPNGAIPSQDVSIIVCWESTHHKVLTETVGQFTGLKDKNGVEIYEGDIIRYSTDEPNEVVFEECCFGYRISPVTLLKLTVFGNVNKLEVIGNKHTK